MQNNSGGAGGGGGGVIHILSNTTTIVGASGGNGTSSGRSLGGTGMSDNALEMYSLLCKIRECKRAFYLLPRTLQHRIKQLIGEIA